MGSESVVRTEWVVIGGGFAGVTTARALALARMGPGILLEQEPACGAHASGRNAGILRLAERDPLVRALARRSVELMKSAGMDDLVQWTGGLTLAAAADVASLEARADAMRGEDSAAALVPMARARRSFPHLGAFRARTALWCPGEGVLDIHGLLSRALGEARAGGFGVRTRSRARELVYAGGRVIGVRVGESEIRCAGVIDASGAWAGRLQASLTAPLPLQPLRRHLFVTGGTPAWPRGTPFVWMLGDELYVRREGDGLLASACDETPVEPGVPSVDASVRERLADKIVRRAPGLAEVAVRTSWACLRTIAPDRRPVIGPDASVGGLYHVSGLAGFGATASLAIGELAAALVRGAKAPWIDEALVSASRLAPAIPDGLRHAAAPARDA